MHPLYDKYLVNQAKVLAPRKDPTGLLDDVLKLPCSFRIKDVCDGGSGYAVDDPTDELHLPASACGHCNNHMNRCYEKDFNSAEAYNRQGRAVALTEQALRGAGKTRKVRKSRCKKSL
jgi:hypothetical protein